MKKSFCIILILLLTLSIGSVPLSIVFAEEEDLLPRIEVRPGLNVEVGEEVLFTGESTTYINQSLLDRARFEWDFGDGYVFKYTEPSTTSRNSGMAVVHYFMVPGTYTVTMTVSIYDQFGNDGITPTGSPVSVETASVEVNVTGTAPMAGFEFQNAPLNTRLAQFITVRIPQEVTSNSTNSLTVTLTGGSGSVNNILLNKAELQVEERFLLEQRNLPVGGYQLVAEIKDSSGALLGICTEKFTKAYEGLPVVGIDEWNSICIDGEPAFIVAPAVAVNESHFGYYTTEFNTLYRIGYYSDAQSGNHTPAMWADYLNEGQNKGWMAIGPRNGLYEYSKHPRNSSLETMKDFVTVAKNHDALLMWDWRTTAYNDVSQGTNIPPTVAAAWTYATKEEDPHHPVAFTVNGRNYLGTTSSSYYNYINSKSSGVFGNKNTAYADMLVMNDLYPLYYRTNSILFNKDRGIMDLYVQAIKNIQEWNHYLMPISVCVETYSGTGSLPAPTGEQVLMEAWLAVVNGAKMINFWQRNISDGLNFAAMREFTGAMETYGSIILGPADVTPVSDDSNIRTNRVDTLTRKDGDYMYLFAVRLTEPEPLPVETNHQAPEKQEPDTITTTFTVPEIDSGSVDIMNGLGEITGMLHIENGQFIDTFGKCDYRIYRINESPPALESIAVTAPPSKTSYFVGESLDITGLVVQGTYTDGSTSVLPITMDNISGFDSSEPITSQAVTVAYEDKTATFTVNILDYPEDLPPSIVSFTASQDTINVGESVTLSWNVLGATSLQFTTPRIYDLTVDTTSKVFIPSATRVYTFTATNNNGTTTATLTVNVNEFGTDTTVFQWPDYIFEDQMEYGDFHLWDLPSAGVNGTVELVSEPHHSGIAAMKCSVQGTATTGKTAFVQGTVDKSYDVMYGRVYAYFGNDINIAANEQIYFLSPTKVGVGGIANILLVQNTSGGLTLRGVGGGKTANGTTVINKGEWYALEFCYNKIESSFTVWLNDQQELVLTGMTLPNQADGIRAGIHRVAGTSGNTYGSIYIDDVFVDTEPIGLASPHVRLYTPDFRSRIGVKAIAILTGQESGDRLTATLTDNTTYSQVQLNETGPFDGRVEITVNLRGLPASTYTLTVRLLTSSGQEKASASQTWEKAYDGDPTGYSIDEKNNITFQGEKVFPVTPFFLRLDEIANWYNSNYINLDFGTTWNLPEVGPEGFEYYLDTARNTYSQAMALGPGFDERFDRFSTNGKGANTERWNPVAIVEYLELLKDHPALAWWHWREEPENWGYTSPEVKTWWDLIKLNDPKRPTEMVNMGYSYLPEAGGGWNKVIRSYCYPYLVADIYSWDIYPVERGGSDLAFDQYVRAMIASRSWNMDLVPVIPYVQTADTRTDQGGGTPTADELLQMCWSMVIHGAKGIHWYHYQGTTPPENLNAMAKFKNDTEQLTDIILGDELPATVQGTELGDGRVDYVTKTDGTDTYIFAVNMKHASESVEFTVDPGINATSVEVYGEGRSIAIVDGKFTDNFTSLGYHIYKVIN